jgi:general secretion pathway protein D
MKQVIAPVVFVLSMALAACASTRHFDEANRLLADGRSEEGLARLELAYRDNPRSAPVRAALLRERERQAGDFISTGEAALRAGQLDAAEQAFGRAAQVDPGNTRVAGMAAEVQRARSHERLVAEAARLEAAGDADAAEQRLRSVLAENPAQPAARQALRRLMESAVAAQPAPQLKVQFRKPISLEFRETQLRTVFEMLSKAAGINFVLDRDVKSDQKLSIFVRATSVEDLLKLLLATNGLDRKVLNENSVLIYPNTPAKQKDYRELVVRSYYLANADVKQASAMVKAMVKTQDVFVDEKLNLLVLKDSPEVIRLADQLVRALDVAEPEVMLEVEVLEVARTRLQEIGVRYPGSVNLGAAPVSGATGTATAAATQPIDGPMIFTIANPALVFNLRATVNQTNLLANPRIRVKNREKARIHIGDKVPVFTSTATANVGVSTNVSYLDVGLKLDVESQVFLNDEVAIKVGLEVSNIIETITVATGTGSTVAYRLGTRNTNTVLQLRDGETQILAGLISDEDRRSAARIPGLGDIPLLSRIFGSQSDNRVKSEIVLLITPRVVRNVYRPEGLLAELPVGPDTFPGASPLRLSTTRPGALALAPGQGGPAAAESARPMVPAATPFEIALAAPQAVKAGSEFVVSVRLPSAADLVTGQIEVGFDDKVLELLGGAAAASGTAKIPIAAGSLVKTLRFRAIGAPGKTGRIEVRAVDGADSSGFAVGVSTPPPFEIALQP